jgi:hypothetical protein
MTLAFAQVPDQLTVVALDPGSGRFGPGSDYVFDCWTPIVGSTVLLWRTPGAGCSGGWERVRRCRDGGHLHLGRPRRWHGQERHRAADDRPHGGLRAGAVCHGSRLLGVRTALDLLSATQVARLSGTARWSHELAAAMQ